jgi:phosphoglycerate dehydrogenase-like enzyme
MIESVRVLFGREMFNDGVPWTDLSPLLPGWDIRVSAAPDLLDNIEGVDVLCPFGAVVDRGLIAAGGFGLIQQFGVGLDNVDIDAATEHGVPVARLPGDQTGNADSVAELALLKVLALLRQFDQARSALRTGRWGQPVGRSLIDSTVLIVGLGAIGTAVARRLRGFGPRILAVRAHPDRGGVEGVEQVFGGDALHEALGQADVVVCCAMFDRHSEGMFDADAFAACKPGAVFVNVARGGLVDETALLAALDAGTLAGAGLDVHAIEPADPASPLLQHPAVLSTPHIAGLTWSMFSRSGELFARNIQSWADHRPPRWTVNAPSRSRRPAQ